MLSVARLSTPRHRTDRTPSRCPNVCNSKEIPSYKRLIFHHVSCGLAGRYGQRTPLGLSNTPMSVDGTLFDMASCTKVVSTTSAVALLFQDGAFGADELQVEPSCLAAT